MRSVVLNPGALFRFVLEIGPKFRIDSFLVRQSGNALLGAGVAVAVKLDGSLISLRSDLAGLEIELKGATCISGTDAGLPSKKFNLDPASHPRPARGNNAAAITAVRKCFVSTFGEKEPEIRSSISI